MKRNGTHICRTLLAFTLILVCSTAMAKSNTAQPDTEKSDRSAEKTDVLSMMPDNTLSFVVVNNPALLLKKVETFAKRIEVPISDPTSLLESRLPAFPHIDMTRPAALAVHHGGTSFGAVVLVPVLDFEAFAKACGAENVDTDLVKVEFAGDHMVAASYNGYAVMADASDGIAIDAVKDNAGMVAAEFHTMRTRMEAADITGGATRSGIETFAALAKQGIAALQARLEQMDPNAIPGMSVTDVSQAMSFYTLLVDEFDKSVQSYAFGVSVENAAIVGQDILRLKVGKLAARLGELQSPETNWWAQLPAGRTIAVMTGTTPKLLMPNLLDFSEKAMVQMRDVYGMDQDQIHQMIEDSKPQMEKTRGMAFLMTVPAGENTPLYAGMGGFLKVDGPAKQYLDEYADLVTKMVRAMTKRPGKGMFRFSAPTKIDVDGKPGIRIDLELNPPTAAAGSEQQRMFDEIMKKMCGPEGTFKIFLVVANDNTVAFGYTSLETAQRFVAAANGDLSRMLDSMPAYQELKSYLPKDAQWGGAIDLGGYFELIQRLVKPGMIPNLDVPATPIGIGITTSKQEVCIHGAVTANTIKQLVHAFTGLTPPH